MLAALIYGVAAGIGLGLARFKILALLPAILIVAAGTIGSDLATGLEPPLHCTGSASGCCFGANRLFGQFPRRGLYCRQVSAGPSDEQRAGARARDANGDRRAAKDRA
jgi:hypothetical protein